MIIKGISLVLLGLGVFVLIQVIAPFVAFKYWELSNYNQDILLADPLPFRLDDQTVSSQILGISVKNINDFPVLVSHKSGVPPPYNEFALSIPKIGLDNIKVAVNSNEFDNQLAQLPGTALPGNKGNVFISGHSSLSPTIRVEGKKAFFVDLPKIKKGDEVVVQALGQRFSYQVEGIKIVDPKDVGVINPPDNDGRYLTLMTCVPPGFYTKRLIVLARLK